MQNKIIAKFMAVLMVAGLTGCPEQGGGDVSEARTALPNELKIDVPASAQKIGYALGELSPAYQITRGVSVHLNGGMAWVLITVRVISLFPPTEVDGNSFTWGPWDGGALNPSIYRLRMSSPADGTWEWSLEGRRKAEPSAAFQAVASGVAHKGRPGRGTGSYTLDFETAEYLDPAGNNGHGEVSVSYDLESAPAHVTLDATADENGAPVDWHYEYAEHADGAGDFQLRATADLDNGGLPELAEIRSRWLATGAGRSDARVTGGDLAVSLSVTASECWDTNFGRVYYADSAGWLPTEGTAAACAVTGALFPE